MFAILSLQVSRNMKSIAAGPLKWSQGYNSLQDLLTRERQGGGVAKRGGGTSQGDPPQRIVSAPPHLGRFALAPPMPDLYFIPF